VATVDVLPTLASVTGATVPKDRTIDGLSFKHILKGKVNKSLKREFYLSTYSKKDNAIRVGDWKYRKGGTTDYPKKDAPVEVQLFNLKEDPNERNNLASKYPDKVKEMAQLFENKLQEIKQ